MDAQSAPSSAFTVAAIAGLVLLAIVGLVIALMRRRQAQALRISTEAADPPSPSRPPSEPGPRRGPPSSGDPNATAEDTTTSVRTSVYKPRSGQPRPIDAASAQASAPVKRGQRGGVESEERTAGATGPDLETLAVAARTIILQAMAERCPAGWRALALIPPPHPRQMTWHLHLNVDTALDLLDGRTVPATPPASTQEWKLPSGRTVGFEVGDPVPAPGEETRVVRVAGPYVSVLYRAGQPGSFLLVATSPAGQHEYRAAADRPQRLGAVLEQALSNAIGERRGETTAMGYSPASWSAHERVWLEILGR